MFDQLFIELKGADIVRMQNHILLHRLNILKKTQKSLLLESIAQKRSQFVNNTMLKAFQPYSTLNTVKILNHTKEAVKQKILFDLCRIPMIQTRQSLF